MKYVLDDVAIVASNTVDESHDVTVKLEGVPRPPPVWLIFPIGMALGVIYLATRK